MLDKFSGDTRRVGVLLADNDEGRKKGVVISVADVSPWLRSCKICRKRAFPSSLVWKRMEAELTQENIRIIDFGYESLRIE